MNCVGVRAKDSERRWRTSLNAVEALLTFTAPSPHTRRLLSFEQHAKHTHGATGVHPRWLESLSQPSRNASDTKHAKFALAFVNRTAQCCLPHRL